VAGLAQCGFVEDEKLSGARAAAEVDTGSA